MVKYSLKRLVYMIPVTIAVVFIVYLIMYLTPGDPVALMLGAEATPELIQETREALGITKPFLTQFTNYVVNLFQGDFGVSWYTGREVAERLFASIPYTLILTFSGMFVALICSIPMGVMAAVKQNTPVDYIVSVLAICGVSAPSFWVGIMLILLLAVEFQLLPSAGIDGWTSYIMPTLTMGFNMLASVTRTQRSSMLEVLRADYIRTAKAKGVSNFNATYKHALRNAIIPAITVAGINFGTLMAGSVAIETVFAIPGVGRLMIDSIKLHDTPTVVGCMVFVALMVSIINLVVDLLYAFIDPRIKAQYIREGGSK
ncbi:MAG: ABC transporter permease [Firmicutes bacterium]|nr:ABC transporter permease [Bacillota bacterium]MBQ8591074.1 ABC transporter permease [Bacillota bacterium]